tara:strand:- start:2791 stop:3513 length:723 start_codon:yes stop_codon:yes gene_type:complete
MTVNITSRGTANMSGLEVFSSIDNYNGEYVNWGDAFSYVNQLTSDPDYTVGSSADDPHIDALVNAPQTSAGQWMRYHTDLGGSYSGTTAPTSAHGLFTFNGQMGEIYPSYSGAYQMMSLDAGTEYEIRVLTSIHTGTGSLYVNVYSPKSDTFDLISTKTITYPVTRTSTALITSTFTAVTANDILVLYFTTSETSAQTASICNVTVQHKENFLAPIYAEDKSGNAHKVLRRSFGNEALNT